jgi:hypothetical protein
MQVCILRRLPTLPIYLDLTLGYVGITGGVRSQIDVALLKLGTCSPWLKSGGEETALNTFRLGIWFSSPFAEQIQHTSLYTVHPLISIIIIAHFFT